MSLVSPQFIQRAIDYPQQIISCKDFHVGIDCNQKMFNQFIAGVRNVTKMYLIVHLVPFIMFKRKKLKQNPRHELWKLVKAFIKSLLFAAGYSALIRRTVCFYTTVKNSEGIVSVVSAVVSAPTLCFQPISRQSQIALFCLNKAIQATYYMAKRRNLPVTLPYGEGVLLSTAMSIIFYHYFNNREAIRGNYLAILDKMMGDS